MLTEFRELCSILFIGAVVIIAAIAPIAVILEANLSHQCSNYKEMTGKEVSYKWFDTCYVEHNGKFMRWDEYKAYITANGISQ